MEKTNKRNERKKEQRRKEGTHFPKKGVFSYSRISFLSLKNKNNSKYPVKCD